MLKDPEHTVWIGLEYFCNEGDKMWNTPDDEFIKFAINELDSIGIIDKADVKDSVRIKMKKAYPKNKKAAVESLKLKKSGEKYILVFGYYGSNSKSATTMNYVFSIAQSGNSLKLAYVEPADENAQKTINAFPEIETLFNTLGGSFSLAPKEVINPSLGMTITNTSNSALWMHIAGKI